MQSNANAKHCKCKAIEMITNTNAKQCQWKGGILIELGGNGSWIEVELEASSVTRYLHFGIKTPKSIPIGYRTAPSKLYLNHSIPYVFGLPLLIIMMIHGNFFTSLNHQYQSSFDEMMIEARFVDIN